MICQKCHKNLATMRYAEVIKGRVSELMICASCYASMSQDETAGFEIAGTAPSPRMKTLRRATRNADQEKTKLVCGTCQTAGSEVLETHRAGCSACYEEFREILAPVLEELHGAARHRGRTAHIDTVRARLRADLLMRRSLLRSALQSEQYEEAACLRDAIRDIENSLNQPEAETERVKCALCGAAIDEPGKMFCPACQTSLVKNVFKTASPLGHARQSGKD